jgi:AraC-like DNA-binding protein
MATAPLPARVAPPLRLVRAASLAPLAAFRSRVGLPNPEVLRGPAVRGAVLPLVHGARIWEATAEAMGDPGVAFRVAGGLEMPLGRRAAAAATLGEGLHAAVRASTDYCAGQRLWLEEAGDDVRLWRRFPAEVRRGRRQASDFALRAMIDLVRLAAGPDWRPDELHLEGPPPPHAEELAALCEGPVHFGAHGDAVELPRELLARRLAVRRADPPAPVLPASDFESSVRVAMQMLLALGELTLPHLAEAAGTSVRTLQRRLGESGLSFADLAAEARYETAARMLREPKARVIDVAAELGYTDSANFTRAFRRWAGVPPSAFRRATGAK